MRYILPCFFSFLLFYSSTIASSHTKKKEANLSDLSSCIQNSKIPFKAKGDFFTAWDGRDYTKLFIKGINLGVSVPGTQPGELAATREQYRRWFKEIKDIGFNCIRLFTLHYPRFYEELREYNLQHPESPLLVFQGIWLDELSDLNLYNQTSAFEQEIQYVIDCVHGNKSIPTRYGKAYGLYTSDISQWVIGYIIGREVYPSEIKKTNSSNSGTSSFNGSFLSITNGTPSEVWATARMEKVISYENSNYDTQRPVSFSSWSTLDPLTHPTEANTQDGIEDSEELDFTKISGSKSDAGFFVSHHAYPYYPDFISEEPSYQTKQDAFGPNSYLGYLMDLKNYYNDIPLLIGEFGVPSSWGTGHYAHSKMNQGGISEEMQGVYSIRMLNNMRDASLAGGIQFAWLDEWFKSTWITNPYSNADTRHIWHNITSPEQNFGLVAFSTPSKKQSTIGNFSPGSVEAIKALADPSFFNITVVTETEERMNDDYWLAIDTYDKNTGESILPNGKSITSGSNTNRAEFALKFNLSDTTATLYVTKAYDVYNVVSETRLDTVISTKTDGAEWEIVRWRTNYSKNNFQYVGKLKIAHKDDPYSFLSGLNWNSDSICIRLPWTLINFKDPSQKEVMHYTSELQNGNIKVLTNDKVSDGIALTLVHQNEKFQTSRYLWNNWNKQDIINNPPLERQKKSVLYIKNNIKEFNNSPFAQCDSYTVLPNGLLEVKASEGLLSNDFDYDGDELEVVEPFGYSVMKGSLYLHPDGSFVYEPSANETGDDEFMYYATDGEMYSKLVTVTINIKNNNVGTGEEDLAIQDKDLRFYPNPGNGIFHVKLSGYKNRLENLMIYNSTGQLVEIVNYLEDGSILDLSSKQNGIYYIKFIDNNQQIVKRVIKI